MKHINQDTSAYRVQKPDGSWTQRVDKRLCRWLAIIGAVVMAWMAVAIVQDGGGWSHSIFFGLMGCAVGGLLTLSLKSID